MPDSLPSDPETPHAPSPRRQTWQLFLALLAGVALGLAATRTDILRDNWARFRRPPAPVAPTPPTPPLPPPPIPEPLTPQESSSTLRIPVTSEGLQPVLDERRMNLNVVWQEYGTEEPIEYALRNLASYAKYPDIEKDFTKHFPVLPELAYKSEPGSGGFWRKGVVRGGEFADWGVYLRQIEECGLGCFPVVQYFLVSPDGQRAFLLASSSMIPWDYAFVTFAPNISFANPGFLPETLTLTNGKTLIRGTAALSRNSGECTNRQCPDAHYEATTKEGVRLYDEKTASPGVIFSTGEGCFAAFADDGTQASYYSVIPPNASSTRSGYLGITKPAVRWNSAWDTNDVFLSFSMTGCGSHGCSDIVTTAEVGSMSDLVQAGTTAAGEPVYVPKRLKDHPEVQRVYENWMDYSEQGEKPSLEVFLQRYKVPVFFWKDAFDRWVRYVNDIATPVAECGKPVIYLYPEQTMSVNVKLPSFVHVTVSEPTYPSRGWNMSAEPNGQLTMKDGSQYGSLFWEGLGVAYELPREGFVVKDGEVDAFLQTTLAKYGLNEMESREFREFWVPRMTGAPYYRVGFLTEAWDKAAPLNVTPRPQTSIRLFMDWRKLGAPISIPEPIIVTPERKGFTLVEWGGTLWK